MSTAVPSDQPIACRPRRRLVSSPAPFAVAVAAATALIIGAALALTVVFPSPSSAAETKTMEIKDLLFGAPKITIAPGDTVTWTNADKVAHTVTSKGPGPLRSPNIRPGQSFSFTFPSAGTFAYFCEIHPEMKGTVTVAASSPAAKPPPMAAPPPAAAAPTEPSMAAPPPAESHSPSPAPDPAAPPATPPAPAPAEAAPPSTSCSPDAVGTFNKHIQAAHLETSPGQQVTDLLDLNKYTLTHTVLAKNMLFGPC